MSAPTHHYTAEALGLTPEEAAEPDRVLDVDFEAHLRWLETGEGEPFPSEKAPRLPTSVSPQRPVRMPGGGFVMSNRISDHGVAEADLCALAERVLGMRCTKHRGRERYTLRNIPKHGAGCDPTSRIVWQALTRAELGNTIAAKAAGAVERADRKWSAAYDASLALPAKQEAEREALRRRQEADREAAERDYDECARAAEAAKALLAEVRAALGEVAK